MAKYNEKTVLFLCTGNYYRSRFAEVLFNSLAGKAGLPWRASSRRLALERGVQNVGPMAVSAVQALETRGVRAAEAVTRSPAQVTTGDLEGAALIIALKHAEHLPLLLERFPAWADKVEFWHVDDAPDVLGLIEKEVLGLVARLRPLPFCCRCLSPLPNPRPLARVHLPAPPCAQMPAPQPLPDQ
jgi:protein-tyrosine phosphatase